MTEVRNWLRLATAVGRRDLFIEWRSRVALNQVLPFAAMIMVLFAFVIDDDAIGRAIAPGLIWITLVFAMVVLVQRTYAAESEDGALEALRAAGVPATALYWGKVVALAVQLVVVAAVVVLIALLLYGASIEPSSVVLLVTTTVCAASGLACVGTLYGGLAAGARGRETLLPLLMLPVVAPVLIGATRAAQKVFAQPVVDRTDVSSVIISQQGAVSSGWPWMGLVAMFAVVFAVGGTLAYGPLTEEESS